jgi:hypothetical protein
MNWIKENKFLAGLSGGTLLGVISLLLFGFQGASKYQTAQENFGTAVTEATEFEAIPLYPKAENRDGKLKALEDYRKSLDSIQTAFEPFRPKEIKDVSPQQFTDRLLAAKTEVSKAFEDAGTVTPEAFFLGFERYRTSLAAGTTTGVLDYQLAAVKNLLLALAKSGPSELKNIYRQSLPEEDNQAYTPADTAVTRPYSIEITFLGTEKSVREFVSSMSKVENGYFVIRSLRISNEKKDAPKISDAKFETVPIPASAASGDGGFVLPGEEAPAAGTAPKPVADSSQILSQVLGNEKILVFLRLDLLQFLPAKKLP